MPVRFWTAFSSLCLKLATVSCDEMQLYSKSYGIMISRITAMLLSVCLFNVSAKLSGWKRIMCFTCSHGFRDSASDISDKVCLLSCYIVRNLNHNANFYTLFLISWLHLYQCTLRCIIGVILYLFDLQWHSFFHCPTVGQWIFGMVGV